MLENDKIVVIEYLLTAAYRFIEYSPTPPLPHSKNVQTIKFYIYMLKIIMLSQKETFFSKRSHTLYCKNLRESFFEYYKIFESDLDKHYYA